MNNQSSSDDDKSQQLEEIVAYLDGELSPQESAQVERRLASDETYRQKLQSMERAWAALPEATRAEVRALAGDEMVSDAWFRARALAYLKADPARALGGGLRKAWASFRTS